MTTKTAKWFDKARKSESYARAGSKAQAMKAVGRVVFTTAIVKGKPARVRIWFP